MPLTVDIYPQQDEFIQSKALFRAFAAGISSGKSWIGAYDMVRRAKPGRLYMVVAPTYTLMSDSSFRSMKEIVLYLKQADPEKDIASGSRPYIKLKNGAEILFRSGDEPEMLRGPNLSGCWLDEASLMKRDVFDVMIGRLRQEGELGWLTATFTPKGKAHWTYEVFGTGRPDTFMVMARSKDNPFNPPTFVETRSRQYTQRQAEQELGGVFHGDAGNHFNPSLWPRYWSHAQNAWSLKISNRERLTIIKDHCTIILAFDWALNRINRSKIRKMKEGIEEKTDFCCLGVAALTPCGKLLMLDCVN